ncbi:MAG: hypothetical protein PHV36_13950 [Elusimicrobiales bacterium]|nr:hypothetical protein [Elusimicrobiales bacterium]
MNKILLAFAVMIFTASAGIAAGPVELESLRASDLNLAEQLIPLPAAPLRADTVSPDLLAKFNDAEKQLSALRNDLNWAGNDLNDLERRARQMIQFNTNDYFFRTDLSRMSSDMSRRFDTSRRLMADVKNLLNLAQKAQELNKSARNMEASARDILRLTWPALQDAAGRLEGTIRSGDPAVVGYNSQWNAADISRYTRQLSDSARYLATDTKNLVNATQP